MSIALLPNLSSISEGTDKLNCDSLIIEELLVNVDHSIHRVGACNVVNKVSPAKVQSHLAIGRALLVDLECDRHSYTVLNTILVFCLMHGYMESLPLYGFLGYNSTLISLEAGTK